VGRGRRRRRRHAGDGGGFGPRALAKLREGFDAKQALEHVLSSDPGAAHRQLAVVDGRGGVAIHTGAACIGFAGHRAGEGYAVQGNLLATERVWDAMARAYERARGPLGHRLVAALAAGQRAGGDARGREAAALLVMRQVSRDEPWRNRVVDLRVEQHRKPIEELARLLRLHDAFACLDEASRALGAGRRDDARRLADEALRRGGRHDEIAFWVGKLRANLGDVDGAVAALRSALRRNPRWRRLIPRIPPPYALPAAIARRALRPHGPDSGSDPRSG
jgi:uncharacterized Ntn-hydrolase superfamily protein